MKKAYIITFILFLLFSSFGTELNNLPDDELVILANQGNIDAQYQLGLILEELILTNNRQRLDYVKRDSFYWFKLAAEKNHPKALTRLAVEYLSPFGYFKVKDLKKAIELLLKTENKDQEASLLLSIIYYHGIGTDKNPETSLAYFIESQKDFYRIKPMLFLEKELVDMIRNLVIKNDPYALFVLGDFYYFGKTGYYAQDYKKAYRVYKQSADLGNMSAAYMVGLMNYNGLGTLKDYKESYPWILKAADAGIIPAINKLGIMSYFGEGSNVDFELAHKMFTIGAENNDSLSQYFLGVMYFKGEGCDMDRDLSRKWIKAAYENGSSSAKKFWEAKELWK